MYRNFNPGTRDGNVSETKHRVEELIIDYWNLFNELGSLRVKGVSSLLYYGR